MYTINVNDMNKIYKPLFNALLMILMVQGALFGQNNYAKQAAEGLEYFIEKLDRDSVNGASGPTGIRLIIPHAQFNTPKHVVVALVTPDRETAFSFVAHKDLLSGGRIDSLKVFEVDQYNFIFNVRNVPPRKYNIVLQVIGEDGSAAFIHKEEDWWEKVVPLEEEKTEGKKG